MHKRQEIKCWWLVSTGSVYKCKVCNTSFKTVTPSFLKIHRNTNKHENNLKKFRRNSNETSQEKTVIFQQHQASKPAENIKQTVSVNVNQNLTSNIHQKSSENISLKRNNHFNHDFNRKKIRIQRDMAIKCLYKFYLSSSEIPPQKVPPEFGYLRGQFLITLNKEVPSRFCQMLTEDLDAKPFSLFVNEISESEHTSRIGIAIKYFSDRFKKFITLFLNIVRLNGNDIQNKPKKSIQIVDAIEKTAEDFKLQLKHLIGIGTHINSKEQRLENIEVFQYLINKYEIMNFYPILCISDSLHKAFFKAFSESFNGIEENLIEDTYNWFYENKNNSIDDKIWNDRLNVARIKNYKCQYGDTSWFFIPEAVKNILTYWKGLRNHFSKILHHCPAADSLYHRYNSKYYRICFWCIDTHLKDISKVNREFESLEPNVIKMLNKFIKLKSEIYELNKKYRCDLGILQPNENIKNYIQKSNIPGLKNVILRIHEDFVKKFNEYLNLFDIVINESNHGHNVYDKIESNLKKLRIINDDKKNLIALAETDGITKSKIISEWNELQSNLSIIPDTTKLQKSWEIIFNQKDACGDRSYKEISFLAMKHLSLPSSDFNVKRIFHQINFIEMKKINDDKLKTINNILRIQHYLININETTEKNSDIFSDLIKKKLMNDSVSTGFARYPHHQVLNEEDEQILFSMKKRLNIFN